MENKLVSVLICTYNSGKYIVGTLKSVLSQSYQNIEILILDNNSSDNTVDNIKSFEDNRIQIFESKKNIWPYEWLNHLLQKAKGDYIAIQDHDDLRYPEKIEKQIEFLEENSQYIWCGTKTVIYYEIDQKYFEYYLKKENFYTIHPSLLFRNNWDMYYDSKLLYLGDAYAQKNTLCKGKKLIYNLPQSLTLHIIKETYSNYTYSWFKIDKNFFSRIIQVHGISLYSFLAIGYEIIKKWILFILKIFNNYKLYLWFDRLPYRLIGNKTKKFSKKDNKYIKYFYGLLSHNN